MSTDRTRQAQATIKAAKSMFFVNDGFHKVWKHYKGGVYTVDGFDLDTDDGTARVRYHRIAGPDFDHLTEAGLTYSRPVAEWFTEADVYASHEDKGHKVARFSPAYPQEVWVTLDHD